MLNSSINFEKILSIAIGGFDGMHCAHQQLFHALGEQGAIVVIETGYATLTPGMKRQEYTNHPVVIYPLEAVKHLDAKGFVDKLIENFPNLEKIVVGYDFRFCKDRSCDSSDLEKYFDGTVEVIDEVIKDRISVHSRTIRALLQEGAVDVANRLLARNHTIWGEVIKGQGIGKEELVPTLNIVTHGLLIPKSGVYATLTRINDEEHFHPSVTFIGHRVSLDGSFAIETHIIEEHIESVEQCEIAFLHYIRDNKKFRDLASLKSAIEEDIIMAKQQQKVLAL